MLVILCYDFNTLNSTTKAVTMLLIPSFKIS